MPNRKQLIEEITADLHVMRNKMHSHIAQSENKDCITHSQLFVLAIIERHRGIGIKEVSKKLNISSSAATQLVDGLTENGYVVRKANAKDRRALHLELSNKGQKHISDLKNKRMQNMAKLFGALSAKELKTYLALHKKILSKMNI